MAQEESQEETEVGVPTFPQHQVTIVPQGVQYEIFFDPMAKFSHLIPDREFMAIVQKLRQQRKKEADQHIAIAHTMPRRLN